MIASSPKDRKSAHHEGDPRLFDPKSITFLLPVKRNPKPSLAIEMTVDMRTGSASELGAGIHKAHSCVMVHVRQNNSVSDGVEMVRLDLRKVKLR